MLLVIERWVNCSLSAAGRNCLLAASLAAVVRNCLLAASRWLRWGGFVRCLRGTGGTV